MVTSRKGPQSWEARLAEATFGERLAEARRLRGETIEEVAEQLRIRPSIIYAMELNNFAHMPHKGYARNMVSSYARYLGLNSTAVTEQFLKEFRRWEATGGNKRGANASSLHLTTKRNAFDPENPLAAVQETDERETITAAKRNQSRSSVWRKEDNKRETAREFRHQLKQAQEDKGARQRTYSRRTVDQEQEPEAPPERKLRPNEYTGRPPRKSIFSGSSSNVSRRPVLILIVLVVAFIAVLALWAFLASTCTKNEVSNMPVTGVSNSDSGLTEDEASDKVEDIEAQIEEDNRYGPFELTIEVVEGASWLKVDIDGSTPVGTICEPGFKETYTVSSVATIEAGAPGYVKVYKNGVEVPLETVDGLGTLELKVEQRPITQNAQEADANSQAQ